MKKKRENYRVSTRFSDRHGLWIIKRFLLELQIRGKKNTSWRERLKSGWSMKSSTGDKASARKAAAGAQLQS